MLQHLRPFFFNRADAHELEPNEADQSVKFQKTLARPLRLAGLTLHAGVPVSCTISPAAVGHGLVFRRLDALPEVAEVRVSPEAIVAAPLCSRIANEGGTSVSTLEHLMAAFRVYGITNADITLDGPEVPILDGSSMPWIDAMREAGVEEQDAQASVIRLSRRISVSHGDSHAVLEPLSPGEARETFTAHIDFDVPSIGVQSCSSSTELDSFIQDIAASRSFVLAHQLPGLQAKGLIRGGSLSNAVVFDTNGVRNPEGLRYANEPARHKVLDAIGDMYLGGFQILANYHGTKAGHALHAALLRCMFADQAAWHWVDDAPDAKVVAFRAAQR